MPCSLKEKKFWYAKNGKSRSYEFFTPKMLRELNKNPCCEHIPMLLVEIQMLGIERDTWMSKYHRLKYDK